jgi:myo-inositol-1(or 4)-monophosphatase
MVKPLLTKDDIDFLIKLCFDAGEIAVAMRAGITVETKTSADDLVTSADKALSTLIVGKLSERFPEDVVLSEEAPWEGNETTRRRWLIDPIDGTKYYVDGSGNWCVMVGLVEDGREVFGCVYLPRWGVVLAGGPAYGEAYCFDKATGNTTRLAALSAFDEGESKNQRLLVSNNDLKAHPWVKDLAGVQISQGTSIGVDVYMLWAGQADVFVHIRPTLKYWDTAAPGAVAQALGMDVGSEVSDHLVYTYASPTHEPQVVIGRKGALAWWKPLAQGRPHGFGQSVDSSKEQGKPQA